MKALLFPLAVLCAADLPVPPCPSGMVKIPGKPACIDVFEFPNELGRVPFSTMSAESPPGEPIDNSVDGLCAAEGKRACTRSEWIAACQGPNGSAYPYGPKHRDHACNDDKRWRKVDELAVSRLDGITLYNLFQGEPAGSRPDCTSASGARDMTGSVEEWVRCRDGRGGWCLMGRFWADAEPCSFTVRTHSPHWHYYQSGGRCCADVEHAPSPAAEIPQRAPSTLDGR